MTITPITLEEVKAVAQNVVTTFQPNHRNPGIDWDGCFYTDEDGCHCVAGQIAYEMGVPIPGWNHDDNQERVYEVAMFRGRFTDDALDYLAAVQTLADGGSTWSAAVQEVEDKGLTAQCSYATLTAQE